MNINSETKEKALIIKINEENIDITNAFEFREGLIKEAEKISDYIILNMSKINYIDSSGLGVLISFLRFVKDSNRELKLANCKTKVMETMKFTLLENEFPIFDNIENAMK